MANSSEDHLPPDTSNAIFYATSSIVIDAPRDKLWSILTDFPSYKEWNTFVHTIEVTTESKELLPDQTPAEGKFIKILANMAPGDKPEEPKGSNRGDAFCVISTYDPVNYRVGWKSRMMPEFLLSAYRWQALHIDEATGKTRYENTEVFNGLLGYFIKYFVGSKLARGFQGAADSLKKRAETE
ncbi:hypothetical protein CPC08DRAFT_706433 [Agrocybe pediades]|nr:hypothetical protein CPC08DRAFT_706433 [Agrocybe pediades]